MGPSSMSSMGMNSTRAVGMAPLYAGQRLPQQGYPGPPQAQPLPRQGVKRAYSGEVYPGQQYLPGGQYTPGATQYVPGPGQPPAPSSYPGHRLPLQQGASPSLSTASPAGPHYKPAEQFNGQGASFNGGSISYSQPGLNGVWPDGQAGGRLTGWVQGERALKQEDVWRPNQAPLGLPPSLS